MLDRALVWELVKVSAGIATREARYQLRRLRGSRPLELARGAVRVVVVVSLELVERWTA